MLTNFDSEIFSWIRGGLFVLFIYHLLIYFQNKRDLYLYYSIYLACLFIYFLKHIMPESFVDGVYRYINFPIQFVAYAAYVAFARDILETRAHLLQWDKYFEITVKALLILAPVFVIIEVAFGYNFQLMAFSVVAPILTVFTILSFVKISKIQGVSVNFFLIGSIAYVLLANVSFLEIFLGREYFISRGVEPMFFIYQGAIIQSIVFSLLIGYNIKRIEQKSKDAELKLAIKNKEMEELKMTALQSQMNPHFLFNSLNSINNFVLKSEVEKASDYITKFSKLIRVILNSSSSSTVTLNEELGILGLYVKLEQMRISGGFKYLVDVDNTLNLEGIKVPPLFLQPFIENSIWHGITKKEGEKIIELIIRKENNLVKCEIIDNGIGINKNKEFTHMSQRRKFFGAKATENRIKILHRNANVDIKTEDISNDKRTGTKVTILFPLDN